MDVPPLWSSDDATRAVNGRSTGSWVASGVSIDSRTLRPGDLFIALNGPNFDGHAFVADALARGAAAALVSRPLQGIDDRAPLLVVDDTFDALWALGRAARARSRAGIAAVTGSVGKTGVKEALRLVLGRQGPTHASEGSLNNHWGVPLSLARLSPFAAYAVFEMGMNHAGELTPLSHLVRPSVVAITTVDGVHKAHFASLEAIADAKAEIFDGLQADGTAVLYRDSPYFARLTRLSGAAGVARLISFGSHPHADVRLLETSSDANGASVVANVAGTRVAFHLNVVGRHWVTNALCVLAVAAGLGADVPAAAAALADVRAPKGRGLRASVLVPGGSIEVIDDSYNASPPSMAAALDVLGYIRPRPGGRRIAVLGDMLELGDEAPALHAALARPIADSAVDQVFTAGPLMAHLHAALPAAVRGAHAADSSALAGIVASSVRPGDVISVKGSAGSRMRRVVDALFALGEDENKDGAPAAAGNQN
ncbi:MAG: UDP-N-acetylmuramoylalanyl-D-glutamyl-2,6-diaminopimelate--D-alanyl-D-alanine ligase [Rhodospirillales bacterium]|nr:UDP-N-acetylmuramoylalanyl-D-glutamyl-2,6-diaminopimelate--D-alanyl-D-alanine ligase [Rhodospirillales bacterium]